MPARFPATAIISAVTPPGLVAFTFAPRWMSEAASSCEPEMEASINGV